jgi:hemolysin D
MGAAVRSGEGDRVNERAAPPEPSPQPAPRPQPTIAAVAGRDREFLPAALEILETPPPPLPIAVMATICACGLVALVWSYFGRLDVYATAPGKIETAGYAKVIEPLDPGKIAVIHVEEGQAVKAGDLLLELEPAEAAADAAGAQNALNASLAEMARRRYAIGAVRIAKTTTRSGQDSPDAPAPQVFDPGYVESLAGEAELNVDWDGAVPEPFRLREEAVLRADLAQLSDALKALDGQMAEKLATQQRLNMSIAFQNALMETLNQRVSTRQEAIDRKVGTKIDLYDAQEELEKSQAALASDQGLLIETDAALNEVRSEKAKTVSQFIADNENKFADAARKADEARQTLAKADARLARTKLSAPIGGVVQQMAVTTVGQVVTTGQQLIVLTPNAGKLEVEALVANLDIGFVRPGQDAVIKVDAFPFTRFGALHGQVIKIASAAIAEQEAKRALANATSGANGAPPAPTAPGQPESFVFPVTIALDETAMKIDDAIIPLTPGMTVTVEIRTDSRRVIDYFLSPIAKIRSEAFKER